ncbi:MAG TPA: hypothetical protein VG892_13450 [Terriglobales bacterium]|nr:hypothetical protein [Terriglobales bacterium]
MDPEDEDPEDVDSDDLDSEDRDSEDEDPPDFPELPPSLELDSEALELAPSFAPLADELELESLPFEPPLGDLPA